MSFCILSLGKGGILVGFETKPFEKIPLPNTPEDSPHWVLRRPIDLIMVGLIKHQGVSLLLPEGSEPETFSDKPLMEAHN